MGRFIPALIMATAVFFASGALAATWTVDAAQADDSGCVSPTYLCKTIGGALLGALGGDTINVLAGTYSENVTIGAQLTITGAQANVDACNRPGTGESIVTGAGNLFTLVGGSAATIINGFTFQGADKQILSASGPIDNVQLLNNRHLGFTASGIFLNDSGDDITIDQCLVDGTSAGAGGIIHLDQDLFHGLHLTNSCMYGGNYGLFVDGPRNVGVSGTRAPLLDGNLFDGNTAGMNIGTGAFEGATISNNIYRNAEFDGIMGGPKDTLITQNIFENNGRRGIRFTDWGDTDPTKGAIGNIITENCFTGNGFVQAAGAAIYAGGQPVNLGTNVFNNNNIEGNVLGFLHEDAETIDATNNYWGAADGPAGPDGTGGGNGVDGTTGGGSVTFGPYLAANDLGAPDCAPAPVPTTSGWMTLLLAIGLMLVLAYGVSRRENRSEAC